MGCPCVCVCVCVQYPELLDDAPHGRHEALITPLMYIHIVIAALYKLFWCFIFLYAVPEMLDSYR